MAFHYYTANDPFLMIVENTLHEVDNCTLYLGGKPDVSGSMRFCKREARLYKNESIKRLRWQRDDETGREIIKAAQGW